MYEDVSDFLAAQRWRLAEDESKSAGSTWIELFVLFDMGGYRRSEARYIKNAEAAKRAEVRSARSRKRSSR